MLLLGALTLLSPAIPMALVRRQIESGWTLQHFGVVSLAVNLIVSMGHAVGIGLLLTAAFNRRPASGRQPANPFSASPSTPMIITRSPLRISLGGGGTDLPSYYREHTGFLVAAAIDKYVYLTLHQTFVSELIIKYSKLERVTSVD